MSRAPIACRTFGNAEIAFSKVTVVLPYPEASFPAIDAIGKPAVSGVFDYAGLSRNSRYRSCSCCLPRITKTSASGLHLFGAEYPPHLSSIYASLCPSR